MFDGGSVCTSSSAYCPGMKLTTHSPFWHYNRDVLYLCSTKYYLSVHLLQNANSVTGVFSKFSSLPIHTRNSPFPRSLRGATLELASNNLVCSVALTGVLALQAARFWAESADDEDEEDYVVVDSTDEPKSKISRTITTDIKEDAVKPLLQHRLQAS